MLKKTVNGTWLDWRDAWRAMGRTEDQIAAEDAARELAAEARAFVKGAGTGAAQAARRRARVRERLHGFTRARFDARCERCARLAAYIVKALLRGWRRDPLTPRELFRAAWAACFGGERLASEGMARAWKDTWEWVRNIYVGLARQHAGEGVFGNLIQSYSHAGDGGEALSSAASDGVSARESKTRERPLKQCSPLTAEAVCGLYADLRKAASPHSKGDCGDGNAAGEAERARQAGERLPRYRGKLPGRCCWKIWETMKTLKALHWPATDHMWSAKHAFAWLASVMAAGKSLRAVPELYYDTLLRWYGRPVSRERNFVPSGMFADLYASARALPEFAGGEGDRFFRVSASGGDRGAKKKCSQNFQKP